MSSDNPFLAGLSLTNRFTCPAAVEAYTLAKLSGPTTLTVVGTGDADADVAGVFLGARRAGDNQGIPVCIQRGVLVPLLSDGAGVLAVDDRVSVSAVTAGRVALSATGGIGRVVVGAPAVADAIVLVLFEGDMDGTPAVTPDLQTAYDAGNTIEMTDPVVLQVLDSDARALQIKSEDGTEMGSLSAFKDAGGLALYGKPDQGVRMTVENQPTAAATGGATDVISGRSGSGGVGGRTRVQGGQGFGGDATGGEALLQGGLSAGSGVGGAANVTGGGNGSTGTGGAANVTGGAATASGNGGAATLTGGIGVDGGAVSVTGGAGSDDGGSVTITGGLGGDTGGSVTINAGDGGEGGDGSISIGTSNTTAVTVGTTGNSTTLNGAVKASVVLNAGIVEPITPALASGTQLGTSTNSFERSHIKAHYGAEGGGALSGAISYGFTAAETLYLEASGNITSLSITVPAAGFNGQIITVVMKQNAAGTATWPTTFANALLAGGTFTKTAAADSVDTITFRYCANLGKWAEVCRAMNLS